MVTTKFLLLTVGICGVLASGARAQITNTIVTDSFSNSSADPGTAPDSTIWTTYNYNNDYDIGIVNRTSLSSMYGAAHADLLRINESVSHGPNAGGGLYSNSTFEVANGPVTVSGWTWRSTSSSVGGDVYLAVTPNGSGQMSLGSFFVRQVTAATYVQAGTINSQTDGSRYYGYDSTTGHYASQSVSNRGIDISMVLTDVSGVVDAAVYLTPYGGTQFLFYDGPTQLSPTADLHLALFHVDDLATEDPGFIDSVSVTQVVPEPSALSLMVAAGAFLLHRRGRCAID